MLREDAGCEVSGRAARGGSAGLRQQWRGLRACWACCWEQSSAAPRTAGLGAASVRGFQSPGKVGSAPYGKQAKPSHR